MKRAKLYATMLFAGLMAAAPAGAADIKERNIKVGIGLTADHPQGQAVAKFGELVSQKSDGKIKVKLFAGGTLGGDIQTLSSLQGGTIEMVMMGSGVLVGQIKEYVLFDLPFLFKTPQEVDAALDGPLGKKLMDRLPEKGLVGLSYWEHGFRSLTNSRRPVESCQWVS